MTEEIVKKLITLKTKPNQNVFEHLEILDELYYAFTDGEDALQPIMNIYLGGWDDLPNIKESRYWNDEKLDKVMSQYKSNHNKLVNAIDLVLKANN